MDIRTEKPIIEVRGLGKRYEIAHMRGGYIALRDVIATVARRPFSFLAHKAKQAAGMEKKEAFWALRGVEFNVHRGEVVGVIGANGAGKSTLLKILSQITPPTEGEVILRGRVGSLLEVGTGFHPELTGRENIFLNGAILGMKRREIAAKFDQIVEFAGVEKFLDTPVKHYSSGMYVRLAFSVAAHMEPDILLVDEVLAVGDAEFQKKCLGKMDEITRKEGRTILFVSHNLAAIQQLCHRCILLDSGKIKRIGPTQDVIDFYQEHVGDSQSVDLRRETQRRGSGLVRFVDFYTEDAKGTRLNTIRSGEDATFVLSYECASPADIKTVDVGLSIMKNAATVCTVYSSFQHADLCPIGRSGRFKFNAKKFPLSAGTYGIGVRVLANGMESDWPKNSIGRIEVVNPASFAEKNYRTNPDSTVIVYGTWSKE